MKDEFYNRPSSEASNKCRQFSTDQSECLHREWHDSSPSSFRESAMSPAVLPPLSAGSMLSVVRSRGKRKSAGKELSPEFHSAPRWRRLLTSSASSTLAAACSADHPSSSWNQSGAPSSSNLCTSSIGAYSRMALMSARPSAQFRLRPPRRHNSRQGGHLPQQILLRLRLEAGIRSSS
jgi:hypothetical protein